MYKHNTEYDIISSEFASKFLCRPVVVCMCFLYRSVFWCECVFGICLFCVVCVCVCVCVCVFLWSGFVCVFGLLCFGGLSVCVFGLVCVCACVCVCVSMCVFLGSPCACVSVCVCV